MKRKIIAIFLAIVLLVVAFLCGRIGDKKNISSQTSSNEQMVVGSVYEGVEFPEYNANVNFSDVSVPLYSDISTSENSSYDKESSKESSLDNISGSSTVTTSSKNESSSSKPSSSSSFSSSSSSVSHGSTVNSNKMKAVWISYIDYSGMLTGKSEAQFKANFKKVCQNAVDFGLNTLICHVRSFGDAIYPSDYFAWSQMAVGVGKNPGYDPLKIMIDIAHQYNLSFHAWINPFRGFLDNQVNSVPSTATFKKWYNDSSKNGKYIVEIGTRWYYNPSYPEVRELVLNGVKEIVNNYNVDGIHFDDYFYPTTDKSFDSTAFSTYGGGKTLENFRRDCVSSLVKSVYNAVKAKNKNIVFGISPDANVTNDMNTQYADVKLWGSQNGYVDYLCPQIYYNYNSESISFSKALSTWNNLVKASNVKLMVGIAVDRIGYLNDYWACTQRDTHTTSTKNCGALGWQTSNVKTSNILERQYTDSMSLKKCSGVFLYRYDFVFDLSSFESSSHTSSAKEQAKYELQKLKNVMK